VIDPPGVPSCGLAHGGPDDLLQASPALAGVAVDCPRGCAPEEGPPDCELDAWVARGGGGPAGPARLDSFRRLLASRATLPEP